MIDLVGKVWALPCTLLGLSYGLIEVLLGAKVSIQHNAICFEESRLVRSYSAFTLGNTIHCASPLTTLAPTYSTRGLEDPTIVTLGYHEEGHTYQYQKYGIFFFLIWAFNGGPTASNYLERDADQYALSKEKQ